MLSYPWRSQGRPWRLVVTAVLLMLAAIFCLPPAGAGSEAAEVEGRLRAMPTSLTFTFETPAYALHTDESGLTTIELESPAAAALPGDPLLPAVNYTVAVPPLVPLESVSLVVDAAEQRELPGRFTVPAAGPLRFVQDGADGAAVDWGRNAALIVDGKNSAVYGRDAFFPAAPVEIVKRAHMRKWRLITFQYRPFSYNPQDGRLRLSGDVTVTLRFDAPQLAAGDLVALQNTLLDEHAAAALHNGRQARDWYTAVVPDQAAAAAAKPGYAIITTNEVASNFMISRLIIHKGMMGYDVQLVTEDEYGPLTGEAPNTRAEKVRKWLQDHYESDNILYVLLIGDPDPRDPLAQKNGLPDKIGDMPMKMFEHSPPTDYYFSDLKNQGGSFPDWEPEVFVGRIPLYYEHGDWRTTIADVIKKTIDYEKEGNLSWRRSALLAMAFLGTTDDGARLAEFMRDEYLLDKGFDVHRLYWHGALSNSIYRSEEELVDGAVRARWAAEPFGVVAFYGHGSPVLQAIYEEYGDGLSGLGNIFHSSEASLLDDGKPAMVMQIGCQTGTPENINNMGFSLLRKGAVTTVAGSRDTYGFPGGSPGTGTGNMSLFYNYLQLLVAGEPAGQALAQVKVDAYGYDSNGLAYNLYGDPSLMLFNGSALQSNPSAARDAQRSAEAQDGIIPPPLPGDASRPTLVESHPGQFMTSPADGLISMGPAHNCALLPDGAVDCQGDDWGNGEFWPLAADTSGPYTQVSASEHYTCGLKPDGSVHCWGVNDFETVRDQPGPFTQIAAGGTHACGLKADGTIACWGDDYWSQGTPPEGTFTAVTAGLFHTCGLRANGRVDCWGAGEYGETDSREGPFIALASGGYHNCGLKAGGGAECWGRNTHKQAGQRAGPFVQITAGRLHSCGLLADGNFECWGDHNPKSEDVPNGPFTALSAGGAHTCGLTPDHVDCWGTQAGTSFDDQYGEFTAISAGDDHVCALAAGGTIRCWGENEFGQADSQELYDPFTQIEAGVYANCGLRPDGSVSCWGRDLYTTLDHPGPFVQFSSSYLHACGTDASSGVTCWGDNSAGQAPPTIDSGFAQISAGMQHTCGLSHYGEVRCWGRNSYGQASSRLGTFTQIDSGFFHSCGLTVEGDIKCWGANHHGQAVDQEGPFIQVTVGWFNSCGLREDSQRALLGQEPVRPDRGRARPLPAHQHRPIPEHGP